MFEIDRPSQYILLTAILFVTSVLPNYKRVFFSLFEQFSDFRNFAYAIFCRYFFLVRLQSCYIAKLRFSCSTFSTKNKISLKLTV